MSVMLRGEGISLRTVLPSDIEELYAQHIDIAKRGDFYPLRVDSFTAYRKQYDDDGFWGKDSGMLVMVDGAGIIVGDISYFEQSYFDAYEIAFRLYDTAATGGRGYTSEALRMLTDYLFTVTKVSRIQLGVHPGNIASQRVAEKSGFTNEATLRDAFYINGTVQDIQMWTVLRRDRA